MSLAGLLSVIAADPQLQRALSQGDADTDLVAPPALRPFLAASIASNSPAGQPRFVLAVTATAREAEDLTSALGSLLPAGSVACFPAWETLPHERLSPRSDTSGRRLAVLRRLAHPDAGSTRSGALTVLVAPGAQPAPADGQRARRPGAGGAAQRPGRRLRRGHRAPGGDRVRAHRPGRAARRVRGPRRHPRRLPAHRGAPAAGRVLGRHGRGDPLFPGRRPAQPAGRRGRAVGAAVPGAAADPGGAGAGQASSRRIIPGWPRCWASWPTASRSRAWSRSRRCWPSGWSCCSTTCPRAAWCWPATPSGSGPGPTTWSGPARSSSRPPG